MNEARPRPWLLAETLAIVILPAIGIAAIVGFGVILGEFMIPDGRIFEIESILAAAALATGLGVALRFCPPRSPELAIGFATLVGLGVVVWGHWVAYDWNLTAWASRYYARSAPAVTDTPGAVLRARFIREILKEPGARAGIWDGLRVRAHVGVRATPGRRGHGERRAVEMWIRWPAQAVLVTLAAAVGGGLGFFTGIAKREAIRP